MDLDENNRIKTDNLYNICLTSADKKQSDDIGNPQMLNRTMNENCLRRWELKGHPDPKQAEMHPFVCIIQQFSVLLHDETEGYRLWVIGYRRVMVFEVIVHGCSIVDENHNPKTTGHAL